MDLLTKSWDFAPLGRRFRWCWPSLPTAQVYFEYFRTKDTYSALMLVRSVAIDEDRGRFECTYV